MMKLDVIKFGLASAYAISIVWIVGSLLVLLLPSMSMSMGGYMMHADFSGTNWHMGIAGFLFWLFLWAFSAGVFASLMAAIYNRLI